MEQWHLELLWLLFRALCLSQLLEWSGRCLLLECKFVFEMSFTFCFRLSALSTATMPLAAMTNFYLLLFLRIIQVKFKYRVLTSLGRLGCFLFSKFAGGWQALLQLVKSQTDRRFYLCFNILHGLVFGFNKFAGRNGEFFQVLLFNYVSFRFVKLLTAGHWYSMRMPLFVWFCSPFGWCPMTICRLSLQKSRRKSCPKSTSTRQKIKCITGMLKCHIRFVVGIFRKMPAAH